MSKFHSKTENTSETDNKVEEGIINKSLGDQNYNLVLKNLELEEKVNTLNKKLNVKEETFKKKEELLKKDCKFEVLEMRKKMDEMQRKFKEMVNSSNDKEKRIKKSKKEKKRKGIRLSSSQFLEGVGKRNNINEKKKSENDILVGSKSEMDKIMEELEIEKKKLEEERKKKQLLALKKPKKGKTGKQKRVRKFKIFGRTSKPKRILGSVFSPDSFRDSLQSSDTTSKLLLSSTPFSEWRKSLLEIWLSKIGADEMKTRFKEYNIKSHSDLVKLMKNKSWEYVEKFLHGLSLDQRQTFTLQYSLMEKFRHYRPYFDFVVKKIAKLDGYRYQEGDHLLKVFISLTNEEDILQTFQKVCEKSLENRVELKIVILDDFLIKNRKLSKCFDKIDMKKEDNYLQDEFLHSAILIDNILLEWNSVGLVFPREVTNYEVFCECGNVDGNVSFDSVKKIIQKVIQYNSTVVFSEKRTSQHFVNEVISACKLKKTLDDQQENVLREILGVGHTKRMFFEQKFIPKWCSNDLKSFFVCFGVFKYFTFDFAFDIDGETVIQTDMWILVNNIFDSNLKSLTKAKCSICISLLKLFAKKKVLITRNLKKLFKKINNLCNNKENLNEKVINEYCKLILVLSKENLFVEEYMTCLNALSTVKLIVKEKDFSIENGKVKLPKTMGKLYVGIIIDDFLYEWKSDLLIPHQISLKKIENSLTLLEIKLGYGHNISKIKRNIANVVINWNLNFRYTMNRTTMHFVGELLDCFKSVASEFSVIFSDIMEKKNCLSNFFNHIFKNGAGSFFFQPTREFAHHFQFYQRKDLDCYKNGSEYQIIFKDHKELDRFVISLSKEKNDLEKFKDEMKLLRAFDTVFWMRYVSDSDSDGKIDMLVAPLCENLEGNKPIGGISVLPGVGKSLKKISCPFGDPFKMK